MVQTDRQTPLSPLDYHYNVVEFSRTRKIGFLGNNRFDEFGGLSMLDDADIIVCVPCSTTWRATFPDVCQPIFRSRFRPQPRHLGC